MIRISIFLYFILFSVTSLGNSEHTLLRRFVMFPIKIDSSMNLQVEDAWLSMRKLLIKNKRFLLASRRFMQDKNVLQSRGDLSPSDVIILGKILDAQAIIVTYLDKKTLHMRVYDGEYGRPLWIQHIDLDAHIPVKKQITKVSLKLLNSFIASVPYQGFVVTDPLIGKSLYEKNRKQLVKIDFGLNSEVKSGNVVQFIRVLSDRLDPLFDGVKNTEVFAEGKVIESEGRIATAEISRFNQLSGIKESTLVRVPIEFERLQREYALKEKNFSDQLNLNYLSSKDLESEIKEESPVAATFVFFTNLALFFLVAL